MTRSFYTVSFRHINGTDQVSRFFNTAKAARKWAAFLVTLGEVVEASVYRGEAGGELIERKAA